MIDFLSDDTNIAFIIIIFKNLIFYKDFMGKQNELEEEAGIGIPTEKLLEKGASPINLEDCLIFDGV